MKIGAVFPQTELPADSRAATAFAQAASTIGFRHLWAYDHVIGADPRGHVGWAGSFDVHASFHEVFVLFGFLAGVAPGLELFTGVVALPQRQTVLVAKQAVELDLLTGGLFRLGVGLGWNWVEYQALGVDFAARGRRLEEQVTILRRLFGESSLSFHGKWHHVDAAGINPLPVRGSIPIWMGGSSTRAVRRAALMADGFLPEAAEWSLTGQAPQEVVADLRAMLAEEGRDVAAFGINARVDVGRGTPDQWRAEVEQWRDLDVSHVTLVSMGAGLNGPDEHIARLELAWQAVTAP